MAYLLMKGSGTDIAVRFDKEKRFYKALAKEIENAEMDGCHVIVTVRAEPERDFVQEYKKIYRRKSIKDHSDDIKKGINFVKTLLG